MKKIVILLLVILVVVILAPKFVGNLVKQERAELVAQMNENQGFTLTTNKYQSGWFGAKVNSTLTVVDAAAKSKQISIELVEDLSFGPLMLTNRGWLLGLGYSSVNLDFEDTSHNQEFFELINDKLHIGALLSLNKNVTGFIHSDEMSYEKGTEKLLVGAVSAQFTLTNQEQIEGDFYWEGLTLVDNAQKFVLENAEFTTKQKVISGDYVKGNAILSGDSQASIKKIDLYQGSNHKLSLSALTLDNNVSLSEGLLALSLNVDIKEISITGQDYLNAKLAILFNNLDFVALQSLNDTLTTVSAKLSERETNAILLKALSEVIERMLAKQPRLTITELSLVTEQGQVNSDFVFSVDEDRFDSANLSAVSLMQALDAEANADIPLALVAKQDVTAMVDNFVRQGYLQKNDNTIVVAAEYKNSQLILNGKLFQF